MQGHRDSAEIDHNLNRGKNRILAPPLEQCGYVV
jgi:hypothetical protein